jgi:two-component system, sensor histidine kinase
MKLRGLLSPASDAPATADAPERKRASNPDDHDGALPFRRGLEGPDQAILGEQVRVVYVEGQRLILTGFAAALIVVWVLWDHVAHGILLGWLGAFTAYALLRAAMTRAYRRRAAGDTRHRTWMTRAQWALAVGGSLWAIAGFLFYVPGRIEYQLFLSTMLFGAAVSSLATLPVYLPAYLVFITPIVAATSIRYGLENKPLHWGIALGAIAIMFIFINFGRYIQKNFVESLRLRMALAARNDDLAERNREVEQANLAKSRFLAAASHDLRQPMHALNLFVAQLRNAADQTERSRIIARIDAAVAAMNELFNALLDISKLDAGALVPGVSAFPVDHLLQRVETTFSAAARQKDLRLRVVMSGARVESDFILLERIVFNLVSNAVRYTVRGGVVVGCRRRGGLLRIEVWDTGIGIPDDQRRNIFGEFYRLATSEGDGRGGLGLGLAIVERLCRLLEHPIELTSAPGKGSRFSILVPVAAARQGPELVVPTVAVVDPARGKLVVVIDDDPLVLDGMRGLLQGWGCRVVDANTSDAAMMSLARHSGPPNVIISDYRLADGATGFDVIDRLRSAFRAPIPAFLITGDTTPERLREARASGFQLMHKPVAPIALRAMLTQLLLDSDDGRGAGPPAGFGPDPTSRPPAAGPSPAPSPRSPPRCGW